MHGLDYPLVTYPNGDTFQLYMTDITLNLVTLGAFAARLSPTKYLFQSAVLPINLYFDSQYSIGSLLGFGYNNYKNVLNIYNSEEYFDISTIVGVPDYPTPSIFFTSPANTYNIYPGNDNIVINSTTLSLTTYLSVTMKQYLSIYTLLDDINSMFLNSDLYTTTFAVLIFYVDSYSNLYISNVANPYLTVSTMASISYLMGANNIKNKCT
jgi:hypothetical protein